MSPGAGSSEGSKCGRGQQRGTWQGSGARRHPLWFPQPLCAAGFISNLPLKTGKRGLREAKPPPHLRMAEASPRCARCHHTEWLPPTRCPTDAGRVCRASVLGPQSHAGRCRARPPGSRHSWCTIPHYSASMGGTSARTQVTNGTLTGPCPRHCRVRCHKCASGD